MMNFKKLSLANKYFMLLVLSAILVSGCSKKEEKKYIARVNDAYLTEEEFNKLIDSASSSIKKDEVIRNWVSTEVLYQQAVKEGVTEKEEYNVIIERSKKQLAASLWLNEVYENQLPAPSDEELMKYFQKYYDDFKLLQNTYLLNWAEFSNSESALKFRTTVLNTNWLKAQNAFINDSSLINIKYQTLFYEQDISPSVVSRAISGLYDNEISILLKSDKNRFIIIQFIKKYSENDIPPFELIKDEVKNRYIESKKQEILKTYLKNLYSKNEIEVKK